MSKRLGKFELPNKLTKVEEGATPTYAKFIAEPFEAGYGHTVGNSLRRVLLSSLEGAAITSIKIDGAKHEFQTIDGVVEDVTDIVLNLKKVLIVLAEARADHAADQGQQGRRRHGRRHPGRRRTSRWSTHQLICTLDKKEKFETEIEIKIGRGFYPGDENKKADQAIGVIAIDSLFSPGAPGASTRWRTPASASAPTTTS